MKTVATIDYVVIAAYMALMVGIGVYAARFNKNASPIGAANGSWSASLESRKGRGQIDCPCEQADSFGDAFS
jgi:hypothetical protein